MDRQPDGYAGTNTRSPNAGSANDPRTMGSTGGQGAGAQQGGSAVDQAKDKVQQLAGQAQEQVTQRAQSTFDQGKVRAAGALGSVAQTLRQSTQQLRDQNQQGASQYVERAAGQIERLSTYLQNADMHQMIDQVEDTARRQPALFLGGLFALGLAGARFLKSSRRNETSSQPGYAGYGGARNYGAGASRGAYGGGAYAGGSYGGSSAGSSSGGASSAGTYGDLSGSAGSTGLGGTSSRGLGSSGMGSGGTGSSGTGATTSGSTSGAGSIDPLNQTGTPRR